MCVIKFEYVVFCFDVGGQIFLIDLGFFIVLLNDFVDVVGVVIIYEYFDYWMIEYLDCILCVVFGVLIFVIVGVVWVVEGYEIMIVVLGDVVEVGDFCLWFFGGVYEVIYFFLLIIENVGVFVNDEFYYLGDFYVVLVDVMVGIFVVFLGVFWLKIGEVMDYVFVVVLWCVFGMYDMMLLVIGKNMYWQWLQWVMEQGGGEFFVLEFGELFDF